MKKKLLFLQVLLLSIFTLTSCDEDPELATIPNYTTGTWELRETGVINSSNIQVFTPVVLSEGCAFDKFTFNEDFTSNYAFSIPNLTGGCQAYNANGSYTLSNNLMVHTFIPFGAEPNEEGVVEPIEFTTNITELTLETLVLSFSENNQVKFWKFTKIN